MVWRCLRVLGILVVLGLSGAVEPEAGGGCCALGGPDYEPVWSPTGSFIAFERQGYGSDYGTYVAHPNGSGLRKVSARTEFSWAPDGLRLVIGQRGLEIVDVEGRAVRRLTQDEYDSDPAWSPDGRTIAFRRRGEIWTILASGGEATKLAPALRARGLTATSQRIAWTPDSTRLAFASRRGPNGDGEIHVVSADGTGERVVATSPADEQDPAWSPDGTKLVFSAGRGDEMDVHVVRADGTNRIDLTATTGYDAEPAWSPDGKTIAFASARSGRKSLYVVPIGGGEPRRLTRAPDASHPAWSPDGQSIAFMGYGPCGRLGIHVVSSSGAEPRRITNDCVIRGSPGPDRLVGTPGRDIVYGESGDDVIHLEAGNDIALGEAGNDTLRGGTEPDRLFGGAGSDRLFGEGSRDAIFGGSGEDILHGGRGKDRLLAADGEADVLDCGAQVDVAVGDQFDRMSRNCELVRRVRVARRPYLAHDPVREALEQILESRIPES